MTLEDGVCIAPLSHILSLKILLLGATQKGADELTGSLQDRHYEVLLAATPELGLALAKAERPDLILMDVNPRTAEGWDTAALLRSAPETSHIPVVVLGTGSGSNERLLQKIETLLPAGGTRPSKRGATDR